MWLEGGLYFASDRGGRLNLYRAREGAPPTQLTHHSAWDARWPSADEAGQIVYELGGALRIYDTRDGSDRGVPIRVLAERIHARPRERSVKRWVEGFDLSPRGERAVFAARGDLFDVPVHRGVTRNLTADAHGHAREVEWSPDGGSIFYVSNAPWWLRPWIIERLGLPPIRFEHATDLPPVEEAIWRHDLKTGRAARLTFEDQMKLYRPRASPDGARLAYSDQAGRVYVLDLRTREVTEVADDPLGRCLDYTWSPHGGHLAMSLHDAQGIPSVYIWSAARGDLRRVTRRGFKAWSPAWDPRGRYLYYLSIRDFRPWSLLRRDLDALAGVGVYALALRRGGPALFPIKDDAVRVERRAMKEKKREGKEEPRGWSFSKIARKKPIRIQVVGIEKRVMRVPIKSGAYRHLMATPSGLILMESHDKAWRVSTYDLKERSLRTLAERVHMAALSRDGEHLLLRVEDTYKHLQISKKKGAKRISLKGLRATIDPEAEWALIFDEVWRRFRDLFYVEEMHGVDWRAQRTRYRALLKHVAHRGALSALLEEMIGELSVSHARLEGGDMGLPQRPYVALPGARLRLDHRARHYRIAEIFEGQSEEPRYRAPLARIGARVKEGDYVLAINGRPLRARDNPYALLQLPRDAPVELWVNKKPERAGGRRVLYQPLRSERDLLYLRWVEARRKIVLESTWGRMGYLHIPDMREKGRYEFVKGFYAQTDKEALIIDVRFNTGGTIGPLLIERLSRRPRMLRAARHRDALYTRPQRLPRGPMACLINEASMSSADLFAYLFRQAGLGPLVGQRTWGGVVGYYDHREPLIDGGRVIVPEVSSAGLDGAWIIEGEGVAPDVLVEEDVRAALRGEDVQLSRAIMELEGALSTQPTLPLPERAPSPVKALR